MPSLFSKDKKASRLFSVLLLLPATVALTSLSASLSVYANADDGVFGDYFRNIMNTPTATPCSTGYGIVTGFDSSPGTSYGTKQCKSIQDILAHVTSNVGIGIITPTEKLEVAGNIKTTGSIITGGNITATGKVIASNGLDVGNANGAYTYITLRDDESTNGVKYIHANSNNIGFLGGNGFWLTRWDDTGNQVNSGSITTGGSITAGGKIIAGTTTQDYLPASGNWNYTLQLNSQDTSSIGFHDAGQNVGSIRFKNNLFTIGADDGWGTANTYLAGKVGIGTSSPSAKLTIGDTLAGSVRSSTFVTNAGALGTAQGNTLKLASIGFTSANNSFLGIEARRTLAGTAWDTSAIGLKFDVDNTSSVNNSELWLHSNGNVGIGTATPTEKLDVSGNIKATGNATIGGTIQIKGGSPGVDKVLTSDANGVASWKNSQKPPACVGLNKTLQFDGSSFLCIESLDEVIWNGAGVGYKVGVSSLTSTRQYSVGPGFSYKITNLVFGNSCDDDRFAYTVSVNGNIKASRSCSDQSNPGTIYTNTTNTNQTITVTHTVTPIWNGADSDSLSIHVN